MQDPVVIFGNDQKSFYLMFKTANHIGSPEIPLVSSAFNVDLEMKK